MKIIKRDGRKAKFDRDKIVNAITKSMKQTEKGIDKDLAEKIADYITDHIESLNKDLNVEDIQDLVEQRLMCSSRKDVAKEYITYRNERTKIRNKQNELNKKILNIISCKNIQNANANVDEFSFGGRKFESAGVVHKAIALDMMRPEVAEAHITGRLYIHD